jgi:hypothetical protein
VFFGSPGFLRTAQITGDLFLKHPADGAEPRVVRVQPRIEQRASTLLVISAGLQEVLIGRQQGVELPRVLGDFFRVAPNSSTMNGLSFIV